MTMIKCLKSLKKRLLITNINMKNNWHLINLFFYYCINLLINEDISQYNPPEDGINKK